MEKPSRTASDTLLADLDPGLREPIIRFLVTPTRSCWEQVRDLPLEPYRTVGQTLVLYGLARAGDVPAATAVLDALMPFTEQGPGAGTMALAA